MEELATRLRFKWSDHGNELSKLSREIFNSDDLTDVTLTCRGGAAFHAHKMVLAASSTYFKNFFKEVKGKITQHQVVLMKDIEPVELEYLLEFIYLGEADTPQIESRVYVCPRPNRPYFQHYPIFNTIKIYMIY